VNKPVVVHAIRAYLARTETFVGGQIGTLDKYDPVVVAHHRGPNREFDVEQMFIINEQMQGMRKAFCTFSYQMLRSLTQFGINEAEKWIRSFDPKLLHFHFAVDAAFFLPLYKRLQIPAVVSLYGYDISSFPRSLAGVGGLYLKRAFDAMDCFLAMSEDMKKDAIAVGIPAEKIIVHYYGIDAGRFAFPERSYRRAERFNILCVGSLLKKKGQHHLLRSLAEVRRVRPDIDAHVTLVGSGDLQRELESIVTERQLGDRVTFAGHVSHLNERLVQSFRDADVFVHFSTTQPDYDKEGIPGTIVEAMASGLPIISTRHAGIPVVIDDDRHGILLEEKDVDGITKALIELYDSEERRTVLGRAAARRALTELDMKSKTRELENIYDSMLSGTFSARDAFSRNGGRMIHPRTLEKG
jgi:colanic acid/amylovoran biosynthesis glycosyltransferase